MSDDLTSFEEWFETIRGIIDEEAATHLQAEIDELKDMLPAGSHIDISTNESTLFNRNVTVSDGVHSKTVQFNAVGGATVESFPYIGSISVTSTDGTRTAEESINIPYFGRYSVVLAFWAATVNLVGDSAVGGVPVTVKDSDDLTITTIVLDASGSGTFTATKPDTYKFIYTYGGQTMETTLQVTQETTYEVEIHGGFNYQAWLTAGRVSETFSSLDDILADEETLRQLMLVHDAVDYICNTFNAGSTADVTKIFNTDLAAKWINNSDYALDHFYAVSGIKSIMDTADKYGYGEWVITDDTTTPSTWGPKGNVPVMTGNTAPYGEASASTVYTSHYAYHCFDADSTTYWSGGNGSEPSIVYKFTNPTCVKRVIGKTWSTEPLNLFKLYGSNDGTNYTPIATKQYESNVVDFDFEASDDTYYLYVKLGVDSTITPSIYKELTLLQFYGRELKVSVPVMTSNTAPVGECISDGAWGSDASGDNKLFRLFDQNTTTLCGKVAGVTTGQVGYKFTSPICVKQVRLFGYYSTGTDTIQLQGSNDGVTYEDIGSEFTYTQSNAYTVFNFANNRAYEYLILDIKGHTSSSIAFYEIQFYGLDYSEKEFEEGSTKKWLYDHGLELETLEIRTGSATTGGVVKQNNQIVCTNSSANNYTNFAVVLPTSAIDFTPYTVAAYRTGDCESSNDNYTGFLIVSPNTNFPDGGSFSESGFLANLSTPTSDTGKYGQNPRYLNVSAINQSSYLVTGVGYGPYRKVSITELWLE